MPWLSLRLYGFREQRRRRVLNLDRGVKEEIRDDQIAHRACVLKNSDRRFGNHVLSHRVVVSKQEDAGLRAIEHAIVPDICIPAFYTNAIKDKCRERFIPEDGGVVRSDENCHLTNPRTISANFDSIRLHNQNVGRHRRAGRR